jgi:hypothetical protein
MFLKTLLFGKNTEMDKEIKDSSNSSNDDHSKTPQQQQQHQQQNELSSIIENFQAKKAIEEFAENLTNSILKIDLFKSDLLGNVSLKISNEKLEDSNKDKRLSDKRNQVVLNEKVKVSKNNVSSLSKWLEESDRQIRESQLSLHSLEADFPTTTTETTTLSNFRDFRFPTKTTATTTTTRRRRFASGSDELRCGKSGIRTSNSEIFEFRNSLQQSESEEELFDNGKTNSEFFKDDIVEDKGCLLMNSKTSTLETNLYSDNKEEENTNCESVHLINLIYPSLEIKPDFNSEKEIENQDETFLKINCSNVQLEVETLIIEADSSKQDLNEICVKSDSKVIPESVSSFDEKTRNVENQELLSPAVMFTDVTENNNEIINDSSLENVDLNQISNEINIGDSSTKDVVEIDQKLETLEVCKVNEEVELETKENQNLFNDVECDSDKPVKSGLDPGEESCDGDDFKDLEKEPVQSGPEHEIFVEALNESKVIDDSLKKNEKLRDTLTEPKVTEDSGLGKVNLVEPLIESISIEESKLEDENAIEAQNNSMVAEDSGLGNVSLVEHLSESKVIGESKLEDETLVTTMSEPKITSDALSILQEDGDLNEQNDLSNQIEIKFNQEDVLVSEQGKDLVFFQIDQSTESPLSSTPDTMTDIKAKIKHLEKEILERKEKEKMLNHQLDEAR